MSRLDAHLRASDAFAWYMERDPALRSTVVSVMWLDRAPAWDVLVDRVDRASRLAPGFRKRVVAPPFRLATPRWTDDGGFDLGWHLRRVVAPPPHDREAVLEIARVAAMASFDRDRPLWEFTLVEGLADGGAAFVMKVHHSLTDGVGGMQLALLLFDLTPVPPSAEVLGPLPGAAPGERADTVAVVADAVAASAERTVAGVARAARAAVPMAWRTVRDPLGSARRAGALAASVYRMTKPLSDTLSPVMTERGTARRLATFAVPLADLRTAARASDGTVNDAFMAAVAGGMRRYHEIHGACVSSLRVTVPINLRAPGEAAGGNRITLQRLTVPVGITDPLRRMRAVHDVCRAARDEPSLAVTDGVAAGLNVLPPGYLGGVLKHVDFLTSNVPGVDVPIYLAGAEVTEWVPFGPTTGTSVNVTLLSYRGTCGVGITIDTDAVPDADTLVGCLRDGFAEVVATGRAARPGRRSRPAGRRRTSPPAALPA
jgi:WS/DGAT/MGAT family acyltransferase